MSSEHVFWENAAAKRGRNGECRMAGREAELHTRRNEDVSAVVEERWLNRGARPVRETNVGPAHMCTKCRDRNQHQKSEKMTGRVRSDSRNRWRNSCDCDGSHKSRNGTE